MDELSGCGKYFPSCPGTADDAEACKRANAGHLGEGRSNLASVRAADRLSKMRVIIIARRGSLGMIPLVRPLLPCTVVMEVDGCSSASNLVQGDWFDWDMLCPYEYGLGLSSKVPFLYMEHMRTHQQAGIIITCASWPAAQLHIVNARGCTANGHRSEESQALASRQDAGSQV